MMVLVMMMVRGTPQLSALLVCVEVLHSMGNSHCVEKGDAGGVLDDCQDQKPHQVVATFVWVNTQFEDDEKDDDGVSQGANNICSGWILH